ncbi:MAG TPA: DUF4405 domain-containing protein, partial [Candidatus Aminicenantes bacterium]|nr:DUF4405 domain-containing protein [Candidatus Aminicenantes bacterium]
WSFLGVDKKGWEGAHILFVALFLVFSVAHLVLNAKPLFSYVRKKAAPGRRAKAEFAVALGLSVLLGLAAFNRWQPFWKAFDLRSSIKDGKYAVRAAPPAENAEKLPLSELAELAGVTGDEALSRLGSAGMTPAGARSTLADIAKAHRTSPEKLFLIVSPPGQEGAKARRPRRESGFAPVIGSWTAAEDGTWTVDATRWSGRTDPGHLTEAAASLWASEPGAILENGTAPDACPLLVYRDVADFSEGALGVRFKLIAGESDQTAGIAFGIKPTGEYLFFRYNTREGNAALWEFKGGKRRVIARGPERLQHPLDTWHDLRVTVAGKKVVGKVDDTLTVEYELEEPVEGRVGLWTKRDSVTSFRDFRAEPVR